MASNPYTRSSIVHAAHGLHLLGGLGALTTCSYDNAETRHAGRRVAARRRSRCRDTLLALYGCALDGLFLLLSVWR